MNAVLAPDFAAAPAADPASTGLIAIVGAGPSGLAAARNLQKLGIGFRGFEAHGDVGGLWDIANPRSTVYHSAHLISSKRTTEFAEFPMAEHVADYPSHRELRDYFAAFADHFKLREHYRFGVKVLKAEPLDTSDKPQWRITTSDGESAVYAGLIIANGTLSEPTLPQFKGQENFKGDIKHTAAYKHPSLFEGKRVLIVGAGNSGCDIAVDAVHYAQSVDISLRRGYYFVPKYVFGKPADTLGGAIKLPARIKQAVDSVVLKWFTGDPVRFGFPKPDYRMYESHPVVNSLVLYHAGHGDIGVRGDIDRLDGNTVHFKDGSARDYDLILCATGYKLHYPFIDHALLNWSGMAPGLFLNIFHPRLENLFVMGMIEASGIGWQGRYEQGELIARFLRARADGKPSGAAFVQRKSGPQPDLSGGYKYLKLERMAYYVHKDTYRGALRDAIAALS
jgi:thioredoxin reductase